MLFSEILGQETLKKQLLHTANSGRIPHAQLFIGPEGSGTLAMAIAYAQYVMCQNTSGENTGPNAACNLKFSHFQHPDLHFIYPTVTTEEIKSKPKSVDFLQDWRAFLSESVYGSLFDWYQKLGVKNKQGEIRVDDAAEMMKTLSLKSYEGGYKFMIIWMAEKMNEAASNKILKMLEEPEPKTVFILIAQDEEGLLQTIRSRCQTHYFPPVPESLIAQWLHQNHAQDKREALRLARQANGNVNKALHLLRDDGEEGPFEQWFVDWVRTAFSAKGNASAILNLVKWSEHIAGLGRETQKKFLSFCMEMFRQALLLNYQASSLVYVEIKVERFKLENFAPYINDKNIAEICNELSDAIYHIERNGNAKIILTDLSIKLTRLIHKS